MNTFTQVWKNKARAKDLTREDMITHCLVKAIKAREPDKEMLASIFVKRAFTPGAVCQHRNHPYQAARDAAYWASRNFKNLGKILVTKATELLEDHELDVFASLVEKMKDFQG